MCIHIPTKIDGVLNIETECVMALETPLWDMGNPVVSILGAKEFGPSILSMQLGSLSSRKNVGTRKD